MQAAIYGLSGTELSAEERGFFRDARPAGYILFRRNIESRQQLRALTDAIRDLEGHDEVPILIDQEGGRVARMRPPEWPAFPTGEAFDQLYRLAPSSAIEAASSGWWRHKASSAPATCGGGPWVPTRSLRAASSRARR